MSCTLFHIIIPQKMSSLSDGNTGSFLPLNFWNRSLGPDSEPHLTLEPRKELVESSVVWPNLFGKFPNTKWEYHTAVDGSEIR